MNTFARRRGFKQLAIFQTIFVFKFQLSPNGTKTQCCAEGWSALTAVKEAPVDAGSGID